MPETRLAKGHKSPASSPLKNFSSQHSTPLKSERVPSSPQASSYSQSPLMTRVPYKEQGPEKVVYASPVKTNAPTNSLSSVVPPQSTKRLTKDTTEQKSGPVGAAGKQHFFSFQSRILNNNIFLCIYFCSLLNCNFALFQDT